MNENIKKLVENQNKIVEKIKAIDLQIKAMAVILNDLTATRKEIINRIGGIETILGTLGVDNEAIDLHQSFDDEELRKITEKEKKSSDNCQVFTFDKD